MKEIIITEIVEGDTYYQMSWDDEKDIYTIKPYNNTLYFFQKRTQQHICKVQLNVPYNLMPLDVKGKYKIAIDPRILQARKEWGMEANPIFA